jgi:hypothetical protein
MLIPRIRSPGILDLHHVEEVAMDKSSEPPGYEAPRIEDHGDLTQVTAASTNGVFADANLAQGELVTHHLETTP